MTPFKAGQSEFNFDKPKPTGQKPERLLPIERKPRDKAEFIDNIPDGVVELIRKGDHLAEMLRRCKAGLLTPDRTVDKAVYDWDDTVAGFEKD